MAKKEENAYELEIDWRHLLMTLLKKSWLVLICGAVFGLVAFIHTSLFVAPKYSSSVMLYVNNKLTLFNGLSV